MAAYKIVAFGAGVPPFTLPSTVTTGNFVHAFWPISSGSDTLTVDAGAYLIAKGTGARGAFIDDPAGWTINVNGSIISQQAEGIALNASVGGASKVNVGAEGQISGASAGISAFSPTTITNKGLIYGTAGPGILLANTGLHTINNSGTITGQVAAIQDLTGSGADKVTNSGTINGHIELGGGDDTVMNTKTINGVVNVGGDNNTVTNSGTIKFSILGGAGNDTFTNSGTVGTDIELGSGVLNKLTNSGTIKGNVFCSSDASLITNSKTIEGSVFLFAGDDVFKNTGSVAGTISLGDGNDTFTGGNFVDQLSDSNGADIIKLGGGDETYTATGAGASDLADTIDGGTGIDTYDASSAMSLVAINLDTVDHDGAPGPLLGALVPAKTALGASVGADSVIGFENAKGGSNADIMYGSAGANTLDGGGDADVLFGYAGNDALIGGAGGDTIVGGAGKDTLTGGANADTFYFLSTKDSGVTAATRDVITDFADDGPGGDRIHLDQIDADTTISGDQDFLFIGTNVTFTGTAGQLRAYWTATGQIIEGDVNGDRKADFSIEIVDPTHAIDLSGLDNDDFLL